MDAGYDALEAAASSYVKTRERDDESRSHRSHRDRDHDRDRDRDRERERRHRDRDERDRDRDRGRDGGDDSYRPDRESGRDRHRERERDRDRDRGYEERPRRRRREDDENDLAAQPMSGGGGGGGGGHRDRRPRHEDPYAQPMRGYSPPRRQRRGDEDDWRGGGGGGGGRDRSRDREARRRRGGSFARSPTPPGTVPLEERHVVNSHWDIRPQQFEGVGAMEAKMTGMFTYGPGRVPPPASLGVPAQLMAGSFPPANPQRQTKRIYIGNINDRMSESEIQAFFNKLMHEHKLAVEMPGEPVATCQINNEKNFAFVEFRTADEATAALQFDGVMYEGVPLRVRRPKDYSGVDPLAATFGVPGGSMVDSPNKLFIGGLPTYLNDEQVLELLKAFGELKTFNLVKETGNVSKGFAFCEYMDSNVTDMAIQGLHNFALGDRTLVVQRAAVGRNQNPHHQHAMPGSAAFLQQAVPNILQSNANDVPPTRVMLLLNMVTPEELYSDEDYQEILEDINEECGKYGEVEGVRIPRPVAKNKKWAPGDSAAVSAEKNRQIDEENGVGRVYVMYTKTEDCSKAMKAIGGRQFGGRTILVANVPEEEFLPPAPAPPPPDAGEPPAPTSENGNNSPPPPPPPPAEEDLDAAAADAVKDIMSGIL
ncbi:uncharacterized protein I206_106872 [Kwoniella pini CBS 10737]|uniref:Splicing factor U2AF 65 kDa subunit n=1 Tax=Kwoniella pini CBS 10737 TaxID=1296096 RepID=A0A1B9I000_9TREE|nr:splicing factor U2AF 65 kDa subunit [Kwoniella pini CBS 10737]OCF48801.1 splicing factor U2AF 65 kDa subunit [Kwoniella pini CBS 10737]